MGLSAGDGASAVATAAVATAAVATAAGLASSSPLRLAASTGLPLLLDAEKGGVDDCISGERGELRTECWPPRESEGGRLSPRDCVGAPAPASAPASGTVGRTGKPTGRLPGGPSSATASGSANGSKASASSSSPPSGERGGPGSLRGPPRPAGGGRLPACSACSK